jgi:hypothetical protein
VSDKALRTFARADPETTAAEAPQNRGRQVFA